MALSVSTPGARAARRLLAVGATAAVLAVGAGCGGDSADPAAPPADPATVASSTAASSALATDSDGFPVDPCALVPKELVESTLGITVVDSEKSKTGCELKTADYSAGGGSYEINVYPWAEGGEQTYTQLAGSTGNPDFRKVEGPWDEAVYYQEMGGALTLAFKTAKWGVSTQIGGIKLMDRLGADLSAQMTALASAVAQALAA
ncbi:DUF3558 family protein [Phytohabitans sp. ZYX-F-186]|uniref:DUF3558 family protein n=1 Tax=Phytohabitans maris TaxID=3071409 RepID=A0ABU0ZY60_9ACTN|nr:DUF3558 family protein [Phytohabitans sp. ZYX-F-186]MDQ7910912.1 DUF3558 family protein [Phytohabitans sp. ZYX-F-186]